MWIGASRPRMRAMTRHDAHRSWSCAVSRSSSSCSTSRGQRRAAVDPRRTGLLAVGLQWVVNAYSLALAGFLLLGGRAADSWRPRVFPGGLARSASPRSRARSRRTGWSHPAPDRASGARSSRRGLSIIANTFAAGPERNCAFAAWGTMGGLGGAGGAWSAACSPRRSWRWVLLINVPIGLPRSAAAFRPLAGPAALRASVRHRGGSQ